jgi:hypothetical protein
MQQRISQRPKTGLVWPKHPSKQPDFAEKTADFAAARYAMLYSIFPPFLTPVFSSKTPPTLSYC